MFFTLLNFEKQAVDITFTVLASFQMFFLYSSTMIPKDIFAAFA